MTVDKKPDFEGDFDQLGRKYYRDLQRRNIVRLLLSYLAPLVILIIYFNIEYDALLDEGKRLHLESIAENQAKTLDLYLSERLKNLSNLIDNPKFQLPPQSETLKVYLENLRMNSDAFVDIGFFDSSGVQTTYAGPFPSLERKNYGREEWFMNLRRMQDKFIITDIYLGFRQKPHFTIAVSRIINRRYVVLRATLEPDRIYEYISSIEGESDINISIVNPTGLYQLVTHGMGTLLEQSSIIPPREPRLGTEEAKIRGKDVSFAYSWLKQADWALIARWSEKNREGLFSGFRLQILLISVATMLGILVVIIFRARKLVLLQIESDQAKAQLEHAARLASIGELAAGIAHEINNPLAVISEEAGLMKDLMDPQFKINTSFDDLRPHLDSIHDAVFRCRDITGKLLFFVRKTDVSRKPSNIHALMDSIVDGFLGHEMAVSNIKIVKDYGSNVPELTTDIHRLQQVVLNIMNNAFDAISGKGQITIKTSFENNEILIAISDTGKGMSPEQMNKIFHPFYTTKEVGKGTGLGLSVSYGIVKSLGGKILVESSLGKGSVFTLVFPIE
jgi:two-component system, NtrC family, sensor kinase